MLIHDVEILITYVYVWKNLIQQIVATVSDTNVLYKCRSGVPLVASITLVISDTDAPGCLYFVN